MFLLMMSGGLFLFAWLFLALPLFRKSRAFLPVTLALLVLAGRDLFFYLNDQPWYGQEYPLWANMLSSALFGALVIVAILSVPWAILFGIFRLLKMEAIRELRGGLTFVLILLSCSAAFFCVHQGYSMPSDINYTVGSMMVPRGFDSTRIVQVTDLHFFKGTSDRRIDDLAKRVIAAKPDLILFTGDLVDGTVGQRSAQLRRFIDDLKKGCSPRFGMISVPGNHEYYSGDYAGWMSSLRDQGITVLENSNVKLTAENGDALYVAGVTDRAAERFGGEKPDFAKATAGIPRDAGVIMLSHRPYRPQGTFDRAFLVFTGHTHGGMIPGVDLIVKYENEGYVSGLYHDYGRSLIVSNGTGIWSGFPLRLAPHVADNVIVTLKSENTHKHR